MTRTILAIMAAAAIGTLLLGSETASARGAGAGVSRGGGVHSGAAKTSRSGFGRPGSAGRRYGGAALHLRAARFPWRPGGPFGASALDAGVGLYEYGADVPPNCAVRRVQISDDWGWRVRDMVVCPALPLSAGAPPGER